VFSFRALGLCLQVRHFLAGAKAIGHLLLAVGLPGLGQQVVYLHLLRVLNLINLFPRRFLSLPLHALFLPLSLSLSLYLFFILLLLLAVSESFHLHLYLRLFLLLPLCALLPFLLL